MKTTTVPTDWPTCQTEGCEKPAKKSHLGSPRKWCSSHQKRREAEQNEKLTCDAKDCTNHRHAARRWCMHHVYMLQTYGDLYAEPTRVRNTHCGNGHEFTEENTYVNPKGYRSCHECRRARHRAAAERRKAAQK